MSLDTTENQKFADHKSNTPSMRLVYLASSYIPSRSANSLHVMKMSSAFASLGIDTKLFTWHAKKFEETHASSDYDFYGVSPTFEIQRSNLLSGLKRLGTVRAIAQGTQNAFLARRTRPNYVYGRDLYACTVAARLGLDVGYEAHEPIQAATGIRQRIQKRAFESLIASPHFLGLVTISSALETHFLDQYPILLGKTVVAHDAADPPKRTGGGVPLEGLGEFNVGYVGHLYPGKGLETISQLAPLCPWATFHIVGGHQSDIDKWQQKLSGLTNFRFHGFMPHSALDNILEQFDVVLAPYLNKVVGNARGGNLAPWMSPLKLFEYMAAGKAIIASDLPVLREIISHNENAILCEPENVAQWSEALNTLYSKPQLRQQLAHNAQLLFQQKYTWGKRAQQILSFLTRHEMNKS